MASSNSHWPSMFKSKPCSSTHPHHQWQHDILSQKPPSLSSGLGAAGEERSPEPKPRWNPRPEQIRILETIFNSGMVNPPRDEIRKIRVQLQEYGQVGDANVFYWFQNRKSRSKHKQRLGHLQSAAPARGHHQRAAAANSSANTAPPPPPLAIAPVPLAAATSSTSSSSERSTGSDRSRPLVSVGFTSMMEAPPAAASPTASVNQGYFHAPNTDFFVEQVYLPGSSQGFCLSTVGELSGVVEVQEPAAIGIMPGLWTELMMGQQQDGVKSSSTGGGVDVSNKITTAKIQNPNPSVVAASITTTATVAAAAASFGDPVDEIQGIGGGVGGGGAARSTVFINGVGFDVVACPFNVREVFGEEAVLIHASGHPVLTDEWGITLHPLQHGASYFLM